MRTKVLAASTAAAVLATGVTALSAYGSDGDRHGDGDSRGRVLRLVEKGEAQNVFPPPSGGPVGTRFVFSSGIYDLQGNRIGRDGADCVQVNPDGTFHCVISVVLPDGELTFQGLANGPDNTFALTGGTGAYRTARGEARAVVTAPGQDDLTIRIVG